MTLSTNPGSKFNSVGEEQPPIATVTGRIDCTRPIMVDDVGFLRSVTSHLPKMTIPSPSMLHLRGGRRAISADVYPDLDRFWDDTAAAYRKAIGHLASAGCTYLQLDDIAFAYLCDPRIRQNCRDNGDDPDALPANKKVVLGLVTTKQGELESRDTLKRRIEEASRFVPLDRLCLSPQCGFSSTHHGNALSIDEQWRKLALVVDVAREVWPES